MHKQKIAANFNRVALNYNKVASLQHSVGYKLMNYLNTVKITPLTILDIGGATGYFTELLSSRYPQSQIINIDISQNMLSVAPFSSRQSLLCADFDYLPLISKSVDLIFTNMSLQWSIDLNITLTELNRVLKPGGLLIFSTLGSEAFCELRNSWRQIDNHAHINTFVSAATLQNNLHNNDFTASLNTEKIIQTYSTMSQLLYYFKAIGANHIYNENRSRGLLTKNKLTQLESIYEQYRDQNNQLAATFEIIYGLAWKK
jgi:malonyl-CoA O-methyltransferase